MDLLVRVDDRLRRSLLARVVQNTHFEVGGGVFGKIYIDGNRRAVEIRTAATRREQRRDRQYGDEHCADGNAEHFLKPTFHCYPLLV